MRNIISLIAVSVLTVPLALLFSCKKDNTPAPPQNPEVFFDISYSVGNELLVTDTIKYTNAGGNIYGVWNLEYYLSYFSFCDKQGVWHNTGNECYVNAKTPKTNFTGFGRLPVGKYTKLRFNIGLPPERNITYCLPNTHENLNMAWPDMMGGGYHFLKLEGYFDDGTSNPKGFAMHMGKTENLIMIELPCLFNHNGNDTMHLQMDVNEWFCNPFTYNFNVHGNYTMGVDSLMGKLKQNGSDVFKVLP